MPQTFEHAGEFCRQCVDSGLRSLASLSTGAQAIAAEASAYTAKSFEAGGVAMEKMLAAPSFDKAMEIQGEYARQAYESFVAEAATLGDLYADLSKEAYRPFESIVARAG